MTIGLLNPYASAPPESPFIDISDLEWGEAYEAALDRLAAKGDYREPTQDEIHDELEGYACA